MKKLVFVLCLAMSLPVGARDCQNEDLGTAAQYRDCIMEESLESVEPALNKLIKSLDNNQNAITAIKQAQTDWEKFKISSCGYIYEINGNDAQAECIVDFNKARVKILNGYVKAAKANN